MLEQISHRDNSFEVQQSTPPLVILQDFNAGSARNFSHSQLKSVKSTKDAANIILNMPKLTVPQRRTPKLKKLTESKQIEEVAVGTNPVVSAEPTLTSFHSSRINNSEIKLQSNGMTMFNAYD